MTLNIADIQSFIDRPKAILSGEELPIDSINNWLGENIDGLHGKPGVTQFSGGASNWTYCLTYPDRELILRRAPKGTKAKGAHNMAREFHLQAALKPVYNYVPNMLALCEDEQVLGADFCVMEKLTGRYSTKKPAKGLSTSAESNHALCTAMLDSLIELHNVDHVRAGLNTLAKGEGYIDRQISGWSDRFQRAKTWNVPSGQKVIRWLEDNKPKSETICITHNDFRFDNLVLNPNNLSNILGVLDWELATLGDPLMDLGNSLAYWVEQEDDFLAQSIRRQPTHLPGMFTRQEVINYYCEKRSVDIDDFRFYQIYGLFRLAGIVQQIYYRYYHKQTRNPAFKNFWVFVHYLMWRCTRLMRAPTK